MKITEVIKDVAIPLISVATAVMVGLLNFQVSSNDQKMRERINAIDAAVKKSQEQRAERESNQSFNIKIYDIVTKSLEEGNPKKQEAAKAFVVVMVDEPLRSSLLNVLKQGGAPTVKADISRILAQEQQFQSNFAAVPTKTRNDTASYQWGNWDFDIFWCSTSGQAAKRQAESIGDQLLAEGAKGRVRIRELPESINAKSGYQIDGYAIRRNNDEEATANALKGLAEKVLNKSGVRAEFSMSLSRQSTPWYISAFVCPGG